MADAGDLTEDRGFKALFTAYPVETVEVFLPEILAERGRPVRIEALQQESTRPDLGDPNRFLDIALLATWADGSQLVILLVEHWSQTRRVDLRRVHWYLADLALHHPRAAVFPVILVTDPAGPPVPDRLEMVVAGITTLAMQVRIVRVTADDLPRLRQLQNRVAALLTALVHPDPLEAVYAAFLHMAHSPGPPDDLERFLPFAIKLARMPDADAPRLRRRLQETGMINVITEMKNEARAEGLAEGRAEGEAEGRLTEIRHLLQRGLLTTDAAHTAISELMATGVISRERGQRELAQLG